MNTARAAVVLAIAATFVAPLLPAQAATTTVVTVGFQFVPSQVSIARGDGVTMLNVDVAPHNLVSKQKTRNGALLFGSATVSAGAQAEVKGVEKLVPGTYPFFCSIHPMMIGTLAVRPPGSAAVAVVPTGATVPTPTSITSYGDALYVTGYAAGTVSRVPVLPGGALGPAMPWATGFTNPLGIAFGPDGTAFVSDSHSGEGASTVGRVRSLPPTGGNAAAVGKVVLDDLPNGRHNTNGLAVQGGRLYIANGNSTDDGVSGGPAEQPLSGTILSVPLGARGLSAARRTPALVVEATGLRNPYDLAFRPGSSELWVTSNGPDALDPYGEDLLHRFDVRRPPVDFGFPACVYAATPAGPEVGQNPAIDTPCSPRHTPPEALLGLHTSANGLTFAPTTGGWVGELLVVQYGSNGLPPAGHAIVRVPIADGRAGTPEDVAVAPAPLDITQGPPGSGIYVADFATGSISLLLPAG
ncbi:MAG TPA: plastocyanin/azurin family copper-binding protein [Mycobacteriales bacterium]|nr:plastocyanin/azurin family copper-binding protein [Mycobacteriales bacterium]